MTAVKNIQDVNKFDYEKMIKDYDTKARKEEHLKKIKKRWATEGKKYAENVEHMKEFREEAYKKKNEELKQKYEKKEKIILDSLKKREADKKKEKERALSILLEKEKAAQEKVKNHLIEQEKDRLKFQQDTFEKSKKYKIIFYS